MTRAITLQHDGFTIEHGDDGVARIRDLDLAERLGFSDPRKIRQLIRRHLGALGAIQDRATVCITAKPQGVFGGRPANEFWLTEPQALFITVKSDAPKAIEATQKLIAAFLAMREALTEQSRAAQPFFARLLEAIIAPETTEWERMFPDSLVRALSPLYGIKWVGGRHPANLRRVNGLIYDRVFSAPVGAEIRARNPKPSHGKNHHQTLTPEARSYFAAQLRVVESIARGSSSRADFWVRMEREYAGGMLQLGLGGAA